MTNTVQAEALTARLRTLVQKLRTTSMPIADVAPAIHEAADTIERLTEREVSLVAAERTLLQLGYTNAGGEYWKPPIGKAPNFDLVEQLRAQVIALQADAERLDWIQQKLFGQKWNGVVGTGCVTQWHIAPDYRHTVANIKTSDIEIDFRAAIDAARTPKQPHRQCDEEGARQRYDSRTEE